MIENPKVGQRAFRLWTTDGEWGTVIAKQDYGTIGFEYDSGGIVWLQSTTHLYESPKHAAAALREQAAELIAAADRLEQEETNA